MATAPQNQPSKTLDEILTDAYWESEQHIDEAVEIALRVLTRKQRAEILRRGLRESLRRVDQCERRRVKRDVKPSEHNAPRRVAAESLGNCAKRAFLRAFIYDGRPIGLYTGAELDEAIEDCESARDGYEKNVAFFEWLRSKTDDEQCVEDAVTDAEARAKRQEIWFSGGG